MTVLDHLTAALAEDDIVGGGSVITNFVVLVEFMDEQGERLVFTSTTEGQQAHTTLGLLDFGATMERARIARNHSEDF